ncbi:hypothetical protein BJV74DRAFT_421616 [Russula compacta]|nr:hypothetical protein BJV74DRAFT_421616 [Russula compacta]
MSTSSVLHSIFSFRTGSTTVLASLFYLAIFISLYITQYGPSVPAIERQHALGLDLPQAFRDLHLIAQRPHPYNSRQNDVVRDFLLERLRGIAKGQSFIHVEDDVQTNAAFLDSTRAVYFQGTNILVKVDGTDNVTENDAVLFSAHFDSVSTAPGATDDGMSVVALIQLVSFLSNNRPKRTAIFNINNGEEDGLHGAHAFLRHPWSNLTSTFLNFEGAGSGGRPFLFRSTSYDVLKVFRSAPHIHADVLSQDAWDRGVIRSDTDSSVYSAPRLQDVSRLVEDNGTANATAHGYDGPGGGMQGADVAFYASRSRYHTMDDSIRGMGDGGAQRSLWALMELLRFVGDAVLNIEEVNSQDDQGEKAVYFELFGVHLVVFRFRVLVVIEIVLLSAGPVLLAGLGYALLQQTTTSATSPHIEWRSKLRGYGRFWLAFVLGACTQVGLVVGFLKLNPNTAHSHPIATSLSALTLAYLSLAIPLQLAQRLRPIPPGKQRFTILVELYALTWFLLINATILTHRINIVGLYWVPLWNGSLLAAVVLGMLEGLWGTGRAGRVVLPREESEGDQDTPSGERRETETSATETTPLLRRHASPTRSLVLDEKTQDRAYFWWIFQFILSTTAPLLNLATIYSVWVGAMPQTIPDGGWVGIVYAPISLLSFLILLPLAPFVHKVHRLLTVVILVIFIASTVYVWLAPPFTPNARLKVFFAHEVELSNVTGRISRPQLTRAVTQLNVIEGYGARLVASLPSSWDSVENDEGVRCKTGKLRPGLTTCEWPVPAALQPSIPIRGAGEDDSKGSHTWLVANVTRLGRASLRVEIEGVQTRACRVYVESHRIRRYRARARGDSSAAASVASWTGFEVPAEKEIHLLRLWARAWGSRFDVELDVDADGEEPIAGRVSCMWNDGPGAALIPALEEARGFLPEWVAITKAADGLVEAASGFVLLRGE